MITLSPTDARQRMVSWHGLARVTLPDGDAGARALLPALRCIQLDPLDRIGTNADLVAMARVDGLRRGQIYDALLPGHAFEHFAKERCLLPASLLPAYRARALQAPWWRLNERLKRLPEGLVADVLAEVRERGPVTPADLQDRGAVQALDWSGWKGTSRAVTMALEVLWTRCQVLVTGRGATGKRYDLPERALPVPAHPPPPADIDAALLLDRVHAAGLMATANGPLWSGLAPARDAGIEARLLQNGQLASVRLSGSRRGYLTTPAFLDARPVEPDSRLRILGPLDPMLWDRKLVHHAFGFEYVWEVYKPAHKRRWGWYVVPLLHRGRLVGRLEAHRDSGRIVVDHLWREADPFPEDALRIALDRHQAALG
ncbi:MAG: hypothetical protein GXP62_02780 [Oligoflexia bacterium]|nr:hypothetical protein [Oligoflexia bacterium]